MAFFIKKLISLIVRRRTKRGSTVSIVLSYLRNKNVLKRTKDTKGSFNILDKHDMKFIKALLMFYFLWDIMVLNGRVCHFLTLCKPYEALFVVFWLYIAFSHRSKLIGDARQGRHYLFLLFCLIFFNDNHDIVDNMFRNKGFRYKYKGNFLSREYRFNQNKPSGA